MNKARDTKQWERKYPPLLLDIMQGGRFVCQIRYTGHPFPSMVNGRVVPTYDGDDIQRFVFKERPLLKGKQDVRIEFSNHRVFTI